MASRVRIGDIVKTNYGSRVYEVTEVHRDCVCPEFVRSLSGDRTPSPVHDHIICRDQSDGRRAWLNGYANARDGRIVNVWQPEDEVVVIGAVHGRQLELALANESANWEGAAE